MDPENPSKDPRSDPEDADTIINADAEAEAAALDAAALDADALDADTEVDERPRRFETALVAAVRPRGSNKKILVGLAVAVMVLLIGVLKLGTSGTEPESEIVLPATAPQVGEEKVQAEAPIKVPPKAKPRSIETKRVKFQLDLNPENAVVTLNGAVLRNHPIVVDRSLKSYRLKVEANGFQPYEKVIVADQDRVVRVKLWPVIAKPDQHKPNKETQSPMFDDL